MVRIVFSNLAVFNLKEIVDYIKRDSVKYAFAEQKKIKQAIEKLALQPYIGRIVPEMQIDNLREMIFQNYRIVYEVASEDHINIITIHHHARSLGNNPAFQGDDQY